MLLRHSPNNVCYSRIVRSASIPNNIHVTLCLLAHAFLTVICVQDLARSSSTALEAVSLPARSPLPLTVAEVRHLLGHPIWPAPCSVKLILAWELVAAMPPQLCQLLP